MFLEIKSMAFAINKSWSKKKNVPSYYCYAWLVLAAMSADPNHTVFVLKSKHTHATFSEFTIVWLNALDKSRKIKTLRRWKGHLFNPQALASLTLPSARIQPGEHIQPFSAYQLHCANHWHGHHKHTNAHLASRFHVEYIRLYIITMYRFWYRALKYIQLSVTVHRQRTVTE